MTLWQLIKAEIRSVLTNPVVTLTVFGGVVFLFVFVSAAIRTTNPERAANCGRKPRRKPNQLKARAYGRCDTSSQNRLAFTYS